MGPAAACEGPLCPLRFRQRDFALLAVSRMPPRGPSSAMLGRPSSQADLVRAHPLGGDAHVMACSKFELLYSNFRGLGAWPCPALDGGVSALPVCHGMQWGRLQASAGVAMQYSTELFPAVRGRPLVPDRFVEFTPPPVDCKGARRVSPTGRTQQHTASICSPRGFR